MNPNSIYLVQSDTTVGFCSQDKDRLAHIKQRDPKKPILITVNSHESLKNLTRVPKKYKKLVRNSKKITFIYPNKKAIRVVNRGEHKNFLDKFGWMYSTSANKSGNSFDKVFAYDKVDIIVKSPSGFKEDNPSTLIKLTKSKRRRIR